MFADDIFFLFLLSFSFLPGSVHGAGGALAKAVWPQGRRLQVLALGLSPPFKAALLTYRLSCAAHTVHSFGIVLWELITSQVPYQAEGFATLEGPPPNPSQYAHRVLSFRCISVNSVTDTWAEWPDLQRCTSTW